MLHVSLLQYPTLLFAAVVFPTCTEGETLRAKCHAKYTYWSPVCPHHSTEQNIYFKKSNGSRDVTSHNLVDRYQNLGEYCHTQFSKTYTASRAGCSTASQADTLAIGQCHVYLDMLTVRIPLHKYVIVAQNSKFHHLIDKRPPLNLLSAKRILSIPPPHLILLKSTLPPKCTTT
jgi:hypothetical protein